MGTLQLLSQKMPAQVNATPACFAIYRYITKIAVLVIMLQACQ